MVLDRVDWEEYPPYDWRVEAEGVCLLDIEAPPPALSEVPVDGLFEVPADGLFDVPADGLFDAPARSDVVGRLPARLALPFP